MSAWARFRRNLRRAIVVSGAVLFAALVPAGIASATSLSEMEIRTIWRNNGAVEGVQEFSFGTIDWNGRAVTVRGRVPVPADPSPAQKLLARRAAVTDLYRRTLGLLYEVKYGLPRRVESISLEGWVHPGKFAAEGIEDGHYVVEAVMPLRRLLEDCVVFGK